jgi:hypothetical protein
MRSGLKFLPNEPQKHVAQGLKRLTGKRSKEHEIKFFECRTPFTKGKTLAVTLEDFQKVITLLDRSGHKLAQDFRDALFGLSLQQLFCDAFGLKFEQEDRQQWLVQRQAHLKSFHPQLSEIFSFLIHNTSRDFKAILGEGFQFLKIKTKLNPKAVNAIRLVDFELSLKGNGESDFVVE